MSQGLLAGGTDYTTQSLADIKEDIIRWKNYSESIKKFLEKSILELKENNYWEEEVPFDFRTFSYNMLKMCDTLSYDFEIVIKTIEKDESTKREVTIMNNVWKISRETERELVQAYKGGGSRWHQYGEHNFSKVEKMYSETRDFLVTLFDVGNASDRLEQYAKEASIIKKEINATNSIVINGENNIQDSSVCNAKNLESKDRNSGSRILKWLLEHFWVPIIVAVVAGIIVGFIVN